MAFTTSGLSNNQVHKEGNRAFVYDSALGTWDQIRETDRTENKLLSGEIGVGVKFPPGHVINYWSQSRSSGTAVIHHTLTAAFTKIDFGGTFDIFGVTATQNNKLRMTMANMNWHANDDNTYATSLMVTTDGVTGASGNILGHWSGYMNDAGSRYLPLTFVWEYTVPASFTNKTLSVVTRKQTGAPGGSWSWNTSQNANHTGALSTVLFTVEEIQV